MDRLLAWLILATLRLPTRALATWTSDSAVTGAAYTDTDPNPNQLGGVVQWTPPTDTSLVTQYAVYIAYDEQNTGGKYIGGMAVGTNQVGLWPETERQLSTTLPANWLLVFAASDSELQPASYAAKIPLYDHTLFPPSMVGLDSLTFTDTDADPSRVGGTLRWAPSAGEDLGYVTHFAVCLADDSSGCNEESLSVPRGTNEFFIPAGTYSGLKNYLNVHAQNPNGKSVEAASLLFDDVGREAGTSTTTATTTTATTMTFSGPTTPTSTTATTTTTDTSTTTATTTTTPAAAPSTSTSSLTSTTDTSTTTATTTTTPAAAPSTSTSSLTSSTGTSTTTAMSTTATGTATTKTATATATTTTTRTTATAVTGTATTVTATSTSATASGTTSTATTETNTATDTTGTATATDTTTTTMTATTGTSTATGVTTTEAPAAAATATSTTAAATVTDRYGCACAAVWRWRKRTYHGCSETPDWAGKLWCMTEKGERCRRATRSTVQAGRSWLKCLGTHTVEEGVWDMHSSDRHTVEGRRWEMHSSDGVTNRTSSGTYRLETAQASESTKRGSRRTALRKASRAGLEAVAGPKQSHKKHHSAMKKAAVREAASKEGFQWTGEAVHETAERQRSKTRKNNRLRTVDTLVRKRETRMQRLTGKVRWYEKVVPVEQVAALKAKAKADGEAVKKSLKNYVDCPWWRKMLGGDDACPKMVLHETQDRRLGGVVV